MDTSTPELTDYFASHHALFERWRENTSATYEPDPDHPAVVVAGVAVHAYVDADLRLHVSVHYDATGGQGWPFPLSSAGGIPTVIEIGETAPLYEHRHDGTTHVQGAPAGT